MSDSFGYALVTAGVGMMIVFVFLLFLSAVMMVLRALLMDRPAGGGGGAAQDGATGAEEGESGAGGAFVSGEGGVPRWAIAGAVAYLEAEEAEYAPRAAGWLERRERELR
ncbi:OadG family protein [Alkalispirochaeta sphaeroplastigenens]